MKACIVIPVLNEEEQLADSVAKVHAEMAASRPGSFSLVIADNGSTDATPQIAAELSSRFPEVRVLRLTERGRGGALRLAWQRSDADVLAYMDVDLSTDLAHLPELLGSVASGEYDLVIGSRLLPESQVKRSLKREILSRGYSGLLRTVLGLHIRDAQCGFKAISRSAADSLLPLVENNHWFFDTELLALAQWLGWRIRELPVRWVEDTGSRVQLLHTIGEDLGGLWRLRRQRAKFRQGGAAEIRPSAQAVPVSRV